MITFPAQQMIGEKPETKAFHMVLGQNDRMAGSIPVKNLNFAENIAELEDKNQSKLIKDDSFGFGDIIDMINPLQHIPVVNKFYQSATGDTIGSIAMIVGGAIFGGPIGALTSAGFAAYKTSQSDIVHKNFPKFEGTTIALADIRQGFKPYNT